MSVKVMQWVWAHAAAVQGTDLLVLLALADWADDAGRCWPSVARLAEKARVSERTAQYSVRRLTARGYVGVESGGGRRLPNRYTVQMAYAECAEWAQPVRPSRGATGGRNGAESPLNGASMLAPEPSFEPSPDPSGYERERDAHSLLHPSDIFVPPPMGEGEGGRNDSGAPLHPPSAVLSPPSSTAPAAFPLDKAEYAFAAALGVGRAAAEDETAKFLDHYRARAARFADWPAAWRKWMRHAATFARADPHPATPHHHQYISREHSRDGWDGEDDDDEARIAALEPTPAERAWRAVLTAREGWAAGSPPPVLETDAAVAVALLGGWETVATARPTWPAFLTAFNTAHRQE